MNETNTLEKVKKLKFGEMELIINQAYLYRYDYGKGRQVLRVEISEENITLEQIELFRNNSKLIEYLEDDTLKAEYDGYTADFIYSYSNGTYNFELQRLTDTELLAIKNAANLDYIAMMTGIEL